MQTLGVLFILSAIFVLLTIFSGVLDDFFFAVYVVNVVFLTLSSLLFLPFLTKDIPENRQKVIRALLLMIICSIVCIIIFVVATFS